MDLDIENCSLPAYTQEQLEMVFKIACDNFEMEWEKEGKPDKAKFVDSYYNTLENTSSLDAFLESYDDHPDDLDEFIRSGVQTEACN